MRPALWFNQGSISSVRSRDQTNNCTRALGSSIRPAARESRPRVNYGSQLARPSSPILPRRALPLPSLRPSLSGHPRTGLSSGARGGRPRSPLDRSARLVSGEAPRVATAVGAEAGSAPITGRARSRGPAPGGRPRGWIRERGRGSARGGRIQGRGRRAARRTAPPSLPRRWWRRGTGGHAGRCARRGAGGRVGAGGRRERPARGSGPPPLPPAAGPRRGGAEQQPRQGRSSGRGGDSVAIATTWRLHLLCFSRYGGPPHPLASAPPRSQLACSIRPPRSSPSPFGRTSRRRRLLTPAHGAVRFLPPARRPAAAAHACTRRYDLALAPCRLDRGGY